RLRLPRRGSSNDHCCQQRAGLGTLFASSRPEMRLRPGNPYPLGATCDDEGTNFALFSENATGVELCLFDESGAETARHALPEQTDQVWHVYVPGVGPGQRYGYRVHGPYDPPRGHRFNPAKLLLDPYAKAINGQLKWKPVVSGYPRARPAGTPHRDDGDSAGGVPKGVVVEGVDRRGPPRPRIAWNGMPIYELHVKGFTERHPSVPEPL